MPQALSRFASRAQLLIWRAEKLELVGTWLAEDPELGVELSRALGAAGDVDISTVIAGSSDDVEPDPEMPALVAPVVQLPGMDEDDAFEVAAGELLRDRATNFDRVQDFFVTNGNEWMSAPDIGRALGVYRGSVAHVLWSQQADKFERKAGNGVGKVKLWRLTPEAFEEAKKQSSKQE